MLTDIRLQSQQLVNPLFDSPRELVSWMGAMQAQNNVMVKWAVGLRLQTPSIDAVDGALRRGDILRTHILRPTWHYVAAEDIRWMLQLSARRIKSAFDSFGRELEVSDKLHNRCNRLIENALEGNKSLMKQEIGEELAKFGIKTDTHRLTHILARAEIEGIICSGVERGSKHTYALLEERAAPVRELTKDEALARLALSYFRSHSPASLNDFVWWSGLSVTEAREAIQLISGELITDTFDAQTMWVHQSYANAPNAGEVLHFLPPFDEYLISYKDRSAVLDSVHSPKAFTNYGIFYPVLMHNGHIVGNWSKIGKGRKVSFETSLFEPDSIIDEELLQAAGKRYIDFL